MADRSNSILGVNKRNCSITLSNLMVRMVRGIPKSSLPILKFGKEEFSY